MMLDIFSRSQNKQTTINFYLRFVSRTLLARDRDCLSVRRFRQKKYSVSTRMEYMQKNWWIATHLSPSPVHIPLNLNLCLIVAFPCPSTPLSSCALSAFCWFFVKQYLQPSKCHWYEPMASQRLLPVRKHDTISAPGRQYTLLIGSSPIQKEDTTVERVGHGQQRLGRRRSPRLWRLMWRRCYNVVPKQR